MKASSLLLAILAAGYPAAFAAKFAGFVPASIASLPAFIGWYAALGVLAFFARDYSRSLSDQPAPKPMVVVQPKPVARAPRSTVWVCRTRTFST